jgi:hypothetical protein
MEQTVQTEPQVQPDRRVQQVPQVLKDFLETMVLTEQMVQMEPRVQQARRVQQVQMEVMVPQAQQAHKD